MPTTTQAKFIFEVDTIGSSTFAWDAANPGGKATVSGDFITATATYTGLPQNNSDFGLKKARMKFDGNNAGEAKFEVFFPKYEKNHPGEGNEVTPNWSYYWKNGNVCGIPQDTIYDGSKSDFGYTRPSIDSIVRLCESAPEKNTGPETFYGFPLLTYGTQVVTGQGKGIQCVAETVFHELHHIQIYAARSVIPFSDTDEDGVMNTDEPSLDGMASDPTNPDTYGVHFKFNGSYSEIGDNEIRCRKVELVSTIQLFPTKDWANPGCQTKKKFGP